MMKETRMERNGDVSKIWSYGKDVSRITTNRAEVSGGKVTSRYIHIITRLRCP